MASCTQKIVVLVLAISGSVDGPETVAGQSPSGTATVACPASSDSWPRLAGPPIVFSSRAADRLWLEILGCGAWQTGHAAFGVMAIGNSV